MFTLIKAQGYSSIRDMKVPGILEQQKSNAETHLKAEKIELEKMKFSRVERGGCRTVLWSAGYMLLP